MVSQKIEQDLNRIRAKHLARISLCHFDADGDEDWVTINGTPVNLNDEDHIGLPKELRDWISKNLKTGDDKRRGGEGAAVEKRSSIKECQTHQELSKHLKEEYGIEVDPGIRKWYENGGYKVVREAMSDFENILDEFPEIKSFYKTIKDNGGRAVMSSRFDGVLAFNTQKISSVDVFQSLCEEGSRRKWWPKNMTPSAMLVHECAHALVNIITEKETGISRSSDDFGNEHKKYLIPEKIIEEANKSIKATSYGKSKNILSHINSVSGYVDSLDGYGKKCSEAVAEALADCYTNQEKANPFSIEIKRALIRRLRG